MSTAQQTGIQGIGLTKVYGNARVVDDVNIAVSAGHIRAVVGENGAGKSTLMKMLTGLAKPDGGRIEIDGVQVSFQSPSDAIEHGVVIVHQEQHHVPMLTVTDNLLLGNHKLGRRPRNGTFETELALGYLHGVGLDVDPSVLARQLSPAEAQLLEIAKALSRKPKVVIFDEPTAALPPADVERLLKLIRKLKEGGLAVLYISHHLSEVLAVADDVTVLRDGRLIDDLSIRDATIDGLIQRMVGRSVTLGPATLSFPSEQSILKLHGVATSRVSGLDLEIKAGEIVGFVGLIGSGMHDAALAISGAHALTAGQMQVNDRLVRFKNPAQALGAGIAIVPEERKAQAIYPDLSVIDNMHSGRYWRHATFGILSMRRMRSSADEMVRQFSIRLRRISQPIKTLSGGNQQKVVISRCVQSEPKILILSEPTRGVDIGAKVDIHDCIVRLAAAGTAVIVVSSEMEEALSLSHRVAVFSRRRLVGILSRSEATPENVMSLATPKHSYEIAE